MLFRIEGIHNAISKILFMGIHVYTTFWKQSTYINVQYENKKIQS